MSICHGKVFVSSRFEQKKTRNVIVRGTFGLQSFMQVLIVLLLFSILVLSTFGDVWDPEKHVIQVNSNFKKVDESLRLSNENFKVLDAKINDNILKVDKVASETKKAFEQASSYINHLNKEVQALKDQISLMDATIMELQKAIDSKECNSAVQLPSQPILSFE